MRFHHSRAIKREDLVLMIVDTMPEDVPLVWLCSSFSWCSAVLDIITASARRGKESCFRLHSIHGETMEKSTELKAIEGIDKSRMWGKKLQWFSKRGMAGLRDRLRSPPRLSKLHKQINKTLVITYKCFTEEGAIYNVNLKKVYDHVDWQFVDYKLAIWDFVSSGGVGSSLTKKNVEGLDCGMHFVYFTLYIGKWQLVSSMLQEGPDIPFLFHYLAESS